MQLDNRDEGQRLAKLPLERYAHLAPAFTQIKDAIAKHLIRAEPLRVKLECQETVQDLVDCVSNDGLSDSPQYLRAADATSVTLAAKPA